MGRVRLIDILPPERAAFIWVKACTPDATVTLFDDYDFPHTAFERRLESLTFRATAMGRSD